MAKSNTQSAWNSVFDLTNPGFNLNFKGLSAKDLLKAYTGKLTLTANPFDAGNYSNTGQSVTEATQLFSNSVPSLTPAAQEQISYQQALLPIMKDLTAFGVEQSFAANQKAMEQAYPFVSAAAAEATARNLEASKNFLLAKTEATKNLAAFQEGLPSNVQNIAASKQGQMLTAANTEAARQYATADQMRAATDFARSAPFRPYAG